MALFHRERTGDVIDVPKELEGKYKADPEWKPISESKAQAKNEGK